MLDVQVHANEFISKLQKRKIVGSREAANHTAELLRLLVSQHRVPYTNVADSLVNAVRVVGVQIIAANPLEIAVGNTVRRVLKIIRDANVSATTDGVGGLSLSDKDEDNIYRGDHPALLAAAARTTLRPPSLQTLLEDVVPDSPSVHQTSSVEISDIINKPADRITRSGKLKRDVLEAINDFIQELATCHELISEQAVEHIHHNDVILTLGSSQTVMEFLCAAKEKQRVFRVFVAEGAPRYRGQLFAKELAALGLQTTLITDSAVFAMISRVNMVIVGAHAIMADGGVVAPVGMNLVALAAQRHAVPFVVLAGSHKLCPLYPHNCEVQLNELRCPSEILDLGEFSDCMDFENGRSSSLPAVINPAFDYVSPKLVTLFITDRGGHNPSFMYRLIGDHYSTEDMVLKLPLSGN